MLQPGFLSPCSDKLCAKLSAKLPCIVPMFAKHWHAKQSLNFHHICKIINDLQPFWWKFRLELWKGLPQIILGQLTRWGFLQVKHFITCIKFTWKINCTVSKFFHVFTSFNIHVKSVSSPTRKAENFCRFALGSAGSSTSISLGMAAGASMPSGVIGPGGPRLGAGSPACSVPSGVGVSFKVLLAPPAAATGRAPSGSLTTAVGGGGRIPTASCTGIKSGIGVAGTGSSASSGGSSPISSSRAWIATPPEELLRSVGTIRFPRVPSNCQGKTVTCRYSSMCSCHAGKSAFIDLVSFTVPATDVRYMSLVQTFPKKIPFLHFASVFCWTLSPT